MNDSDGSHSCQKVTGTSIQTDPDDPGPRLSGHAARGAVKDRLSSIRMT